MTDHRPPRASQPRAAVAGHAIAVVVGWYVTAMVCFGLWVRALPAAKTDGTCEGLGFGCTPSPRDGALLVAVFVGLPALVVSALISTIVLIVAVRAGIRSGLAAGNAAAFAGFGVVLAGAATMAAR